MFRMMGREDKLPRVPPLLTIRIADSPAFPKTIALVRIATSLFFLLFGEYKLAGPGFAHGGFQNYLREYISTDAVSFYRPFLTGVISPHSVFFGYAVGVIESFIGICLFLGLWVRRACVVGVLFLLNLTLASWWSLALVCRCGASSARASAHWRWCSCLLCFMLPTLSAYGFRWSAASSLKFL